MDSALAGLLVAWTIDYIMLSFANAMNEQTNFATRAVSSISLHVSFGNAIDFMMSYEEQKHFLDLTLINTHLLVSKDWCKYH